MFRMICGLSMLLLAVASVAAPWTPDLGHATVTGGARVQDDADLKSPVLSLDGQKDSMATVPVPAEWQQPIDFRSSVKVRLPAYHSAMAPLARPGVFMFYISGEGKPWVILFAGKQRHVFVAEEPLSLNQRNHGAGT